MARAKMLFPPDFLWGTASSSHQVEGNNSANDWWQWEQREGKIAQGQRSGVACNWWQRAEADLDIAAELGTNGHRLSLEWSRIEPEPGRFDGEAIARYREILLALHDRDIEPMVTLHHFSNPLWLVEQGDFNSEHIVETFQRYVQEVVARLGDLIPKWVTINEPVLYVLARYVQNWFPAGSQNGWPAGMVAAGNLLRCHAAAYHAIKSTYPEAAVGVAKNMAVFAPYSAGNPLDRWSARRLSAAFNSAWLDCLVDGRLRRPFGNGQVRGLAGSFDFTGINYFSRYRVRFPPRHGLPEQGWGPDAIVSDDNSGEVFPEGLYTAIRLARRYRKPIYITGNGLPDATDSVRSRFLLTHLRELWRAVSFSYPVMGYYHWSLVDSFEWHHGWTLRFGLVALDPETQARQMRQSGRLFGEICQLGGFSSDMAEQYAPELMDSLFRGQAPDGGDIAASQQRP